MAQYIQFTSESGATILVETKDPHDTEVIGGGKVKATGLGDLVDKAVTTAETVFDKAVSDVINVNVQALLQAVRNLPVQNQPGSMEVCFGLKATGQVGNLAVATGTAEANYTVTFTWKRD